MDFIEKYIEEKINIKVIKRKALLENEEESITQILKNEHYRVKHINFLNNSTNGIIYKKYKKFFFKMLNKKEFETEIKGYIEVKNSLPINKIMKIYEYANYYITIYEYEKTISNNKGLLNDLFVKNDIKINEKSKKIIEKIIKKYKDSFKITVAKENYPMEKFFENRIEPRLKKWYSNENLLNYKININNIESKTTKEIIDETINFFKLKNKYECAITQGDPNTLNIGTRPIFFDFATAGYNPIIAEFSTIFWSVIIADAYFCPKYHRKSYYNHEKVFENVEKFEPNIKYEIDNTRKTININSNIKTSQIRVNFIKKYIEMLEELNIKIEKEIIYFLVMRILCVFNIKEMEEKDYYYSIYMIHYLYNNISENVYTSLKSIINNMELIKRKGNK